MSDFQLWTEKYRPKRFDELIGQIAIVERVKAMVSQENVNNLLLAGPPGCGKTTLVLVAAQELYGESWRENVLETNASVDRGITVIREDIKNFARTKPIGKVTHKICILDEADALTKEAQQALRRMMETYSSTCRFALIANYSSKIIEPIQSRCVVFRFKPLEKKDIEVMMQRICKAEGITIEQKAIDALLHVAEGDLRRATTILQSCAVMGKKIAEDHIYEIASAAKPAEVKSILETAFSGNFEKARSILLQTMLQHGLAGLDMVKYLQQEVWNLSIPDEAKVKFVERCGEIEFRMVEGSDEFLQLEALLASILLEGKQRK